MWHSFNGFAAAGISENEGGGGRKLYRCLCGRGWQELSRPTALPQIIITGAQIGTHGGMHLSMGVQRTGRQRTDSQRCLHGGNDALAVLLGKDFFAGDRFLWIFDQPKA